MKKNSNLKILRLALHPPIANTKNYYTTPSFGNDIMSVEEELQIVNMKKSIIEVKKQHPFNICHSEASGWYTDVYDASRKTGRRKIRKTTEEGLWEALIAWYVEKNTNNISLSQIYEEWILWKETPKNVKTIERIKCSWNSYYASEKISQDIINKPLREITTKELRIWAEQLLKKHYPVDRKKFSRMFQIINECYEYAADEEMGIVTENLWVKAKKKINKGLVSTRKTPSDESQIFTDDERRQIKQMVYDDMVKYRNRPTSAGLQILFIFETGVRIGECCGLKWSDIKQGRLYVRRQANNEGVIEWTKSESGYRDIPLTKEALNILENVKKYNSEHNLTAEWIFQSTNEKYDYRLSYDAANNKLRKLCARLGSESKTVHKIRKTTLSALLDSPNLNSRTVQRFAGHSDISTTLAYYSFERRSREEQARAIEEALSISS